MQHHNTLTTDSLAALWGMLDARNRELGHVRYDFGDVLSHPLLQRLSKMRGGRIPVKISQAAEIAAPVLWRKILGIRKQVIPSLFYHLGMTYMARAMLPSPPENLHSQIAQTCQYVLNMRLEGEHLCWSHPYVHHCGQWRTTTREIIPLSCAHHTCRVGFMLLKAGECLGRNDLKKAGISSARALLEYHRWQFYPDGSCTISYYPNTCDEVINTGADAAVLLAAVPAEEQTDAMQKAMEGLVRMIVSEQRDDGAWDYCTRRHRERLGGATVIDNHHTAMNLAALARILRSGTLPSDLVESMRESLENGLRFYLEKLYRADGTGLYMIGRRRLTGVVGYSEGVSAIAAYLEENGNKTTTVKEMAGDMAPKMLAVAINRFVDCRTGDVACYQFFGRPFQIQSARWGSAPLAQAITDYLLLMQRNET